MLFFTVSGKLFYKKIPLCNSVNFFYTLILSGLGSYIKNVATHLLSQIDQDYQITRADIHRSNCCGYWTSSLSAATGRFYV